MYESVVSDQHMSLPFIVVQIVTFEGDMLFQGRDDQVAIILLKTEIPDSNLETYTYRQFRACSVSKRKGRGFKATSLQSSNPKVRNLRTIRCCYVYIVDMQFQNY